MTNEDALAAAVRRFAGAGRLPGRIEVSADAYRRLERIAELAGDPWPAGLLGPDARLANFIEEEGYACTTVLRGVRAALDAVRGPDGETIAHYPADTQCSVRSMLPSAPEPHGTAFRRALARDRDAGSMAPATLRHDWRWHPAGERSGAPNPLACARCGLIARRPDYAPDSCFAGRRAPVHYAALHWFFLHPGAVVCAAAGIADPLAIGAEALCGRSTEHFAALTRGGWIVSPWHERPDMLRSANPYAADSERADCPDCIAAMDRLPPALAEPHEWRFGGEVPACAVCGVTRAGDQRFGCDGGRYVEWRREQKNRKTATGDQVFHHEDWACATARRKHAGLPMAADGRRVTCFSCLRTGLRQLVVVIVPRQIGGARRERDAKELERAIASAAGAIRDSVRTGASIDQAIGALAVHGPQRLREEFAELARAMPLYGREEALALSQDRVNHPAWDSAALTLLFAGSVGGEGMTGMLDALSASLFNRLRIRAEARAAQTEAIWAGRIISSMPGGMLAYNVLVNPDNAAAFDSFVGQGVLIGILVANAAGYAWLSRIASFRSPGRIVRSWRQGDADSFSG